MGNVGSSVFGPILEIKSRTVLASAASSLTILFLKSVSFESLNFMEVQY